MAKRLITSVLVLALIAPICNGAMETEFRKKPRPIRDGFVLDGLDGKLTGPDCNDSWSFEFDSDITDEFKGKIDTGRHIELLPSAVLEKITATAKANSVSSYKLWGKITRYQDKNFIFPVYFLPLSKARALQSATPKKTPRKTTGPALNDPNDALAIPQELVKKLSERQIIRDEQLQQMGKGLELKQDSILADRTGFIDHRSDGKSIFVLDGLGRNIQKVSFQLLPCLTLQRAEQKQERKLERLRLKVAGIVTSYKGKNYLLLQRARRIYNHGNFGK